MGYGCNNSYGRRARAMAAIGALAAMAGGWGPGWGGPFARGVGGNTGGPGGSGGPRMRRRARFTRDEMRLMLLALIADEPRHGYDLIRLLEERTRGQYAPSPGVIYPALSLLADEGLIAEQDSADTRRRYAITPEGQAVLEAAAEEVGAILGRLAELGEKAERQRPPQIERAAANLFMAVGQRLTASAAEREGEGEGDLPHEIAAILDEAARRIERL